MSKISSDPSKVDRVREIAVPNPLKEDKSPVLGGNLNASGYNIHSAGSIDCKEVNAENLTKKFHDFLQYLEHSMKEYSKQEHTHPEFSQLTQEIDRKIEAAKPKDYALAAHQHTLDEVAGTLPLNRIEGGGTIRAFISQKFASRDHMHPDLVQKISDLLMEVQSLEARIHQSIGKEELQHQIDDVCAAVRSLSALIKTIQKSIPVLPKDDVEIIASQCIPIPKKCDKKVITALSAHSFEGTPIAVEVKCGSVIVKKGHRVSAGDFLKFSPPNCIVSILFT